MKSSHVPLISVVVPTYNESAGLERFHLSLVRVLEGLEANYEIIYCDDGSIDRTVSVIRDLSEHDKHVKLIALSRNFGKEIATTAGMHAAKGDAIITLDADGQHPVDSIPAFVAAWQAGSPVVVGKRRSRRASLLKRMGSKLFYGIFKRLTKMRLEADASDFRLIDKRVQAEFNRMTERNRITRGLIEWMGYRRTYIPYDELTREAGEAPYSLSKLIKLAIDSAISLSLSPLYLVTYIGAVVLPVSVLIGLVMLVNVIIGDPLGLHATASAYVIVFMLFLVGVLLVSQGIIGLYLSHIHTETQNRPLYIIDEEKSLG